jgi:intracellular multiplication protein IcmL
MALKDAISTVLSRNAFYRDGYRMLLRISVLQGLIIILLITAIIGMLLTVETRLVYFATTSDGRIISIVPLNEPFRAPAEVIAWAAKTSKSVLTFDYRDYRRRLQEAAVNFTPTGWESFTKALKESRILEAVEARKLVISLNIDGAPEIKNSFSHDGIYTWYLTFPITINFDGNDPPAPIQAKLILQVVRVSTLQNPEGLSIEQWIAN